MAKELPDPKINVEGVKFPLEVFEVTTGLRHVKLPVKYRCPQHLKTLECDRGSECKFVHFRRMRYQVGTVAEDNEVRSAGHFMYSQAQYHFAVELNVEICKHLSGKTCIHDAKCRKGDKCLFLHSFKGDEKLAQQARKAADALVVKSQPPSKPKGGDESPQNRESSTPPPAATLAAAPTSPGSPTSTTEAKGEPSYIKRVAGKLTWTSDALHRSLLLFDESVKDVCLAYVRPVDVVQRATQELAKTLAMVFANGMYTKGPHPNVLFVSMCYETLDAACIMAYNPQNTKFVAEKCSIHTGAEGRSLQAMITTKEEFLQCSIATDVRHLLQPMRNRKVSDLAGLCVKATNIYGNLSNYWHQVNLMVDQVAELIVEGKTVADLVLTLVQHSEELVREVHEFLTSLGNLDCTNRKKLHAESEVVRKEGCAAIERFLITLRVLKDVWMNTVPGTDARIDGAIDAAVTKAMTEEIPVEACVPIIQAAVSGPCRDEAMALLPDTLATSRVDYEFRDFKSQSKLVFPAVNVLSPKSDCSGFRVCDVLLETNISRVKRIDDAFLLALMSLLHWYRGYGGTFNAQCKVQCRDFMDTGKKIYPKLQEVVSAPPGGHLLEAYALAKATAFELYLSQEPEMNNPPLEYARFAHGYYTLRPGELKREDVVKYACWRYHQWRLFFRHLRIRTPALQEPDSSFVPLRVLQLYAGQDPNHPVSQMALSPLHISRVRTIGTAVAQRSASELRSLALSVLPLLLQERSHSLHRSALLRLAHHADTISAVDLLSSSQRETLTPPPVAASAEPNQPPVATPQTDGAANRFLDQVGALPQEEQLAVGEAMLKRLLASNPEAAMKLLQSMVATKHVSE